jgi:hypothetical protein
MLEVAEVLTRGEVKVQGFQDDTDVFDRAWEADLFLVAIRGDNHRHEEAESKWLESQ